MPSVNYNAAVNITAQYSGQSAVDQANKSFANLKGTIEGTSSLSKELKTALGALGLTFVARDVLRYANDILELGSSFAQLEKKTGLSVQTLSDFKAAGEETHVSFDQLETGVRKFATTVGKADAGIQQSKVGFDVLGVSLKDASGHFKTTDQLIFEVADRFSQIRDGANKTAVAVALFGKSGADMIPVLDQGSSGVRGLGVAMSEDFVKASEEYNKNIKEAAKNTQELGVNIATAVLPQLNNLLSVFAKFSDFSVKELDKSDQRINDSAGVFDRLLHNKLDVLKVSIAETAKTMYSLFTFQGIPKDGFSKKIETDPSKIPVPYGGMTPAQAAAAQAPEKKKPDVDASALNPEVKAMDTHIAKIKAEAFELNASNLQKRQAIELAELSSKSIDKNSASYVRLAASLKDAVYQSELAKEKQTASDYEKKATEQIDLQKLELQQTTMATPAYEKLIAAKKLELQASEATKHMTQEGAAAYRDATDAVREQTDALIDMQEAQKKSFGEGAQEAWKEYAESAKNVAAQTKQLFSDAFKGTEDALVSFVKTGKLSFASLTDAIETDLIRIAVRQALVFGISAVFGAPTATPAVTPHANGGVMTSSGPMPLRKYASGGVATSPQLALFGEGSKPEAFVPLPDGRSIPVNMRGGAGGTTVQVNVNMNSDGSATSKTQALEQGEQGRQLGAVISAAVKNEIMNQKRPGGLLA